MVEVFPGKRRRAYIGAALDKKPTLQTLHHVAITDRANLKQRPNKTENQAVALQRLYYNMMLLCKWHGGSIPRKEEESIYWRRAGQKANTAELHVLAQRFRN